MPQRISRIKVEGGPQGADAFLIIQLPTVDEQIEHLHQVRSLEAREAELVAREYLADHIVEWNWVDSQGDPLPQPYSNPDIFGQLLHGEMTFIGKALSSKTDEAPPPPDRLSRADRLAAQLFHSRRETKKK